MTQLSKLLFVSVFLAGGGVAVSAGPAYGADFSAFGADEDVCRQAGAAAIGGATGAEAAQRYDVAHGQCMMAHARARIMDEYRNAAPPPFLYGRPDNYDYPNAYYSVPYATPGYGYDGFSPR